MWMVMMMTSDWTVVSTNRMEAEETTVPRSCRNRDRRRGRRLNWRWPGRWKPRAGGERWRCRLHRPNGLNRGVGLKPSASGASAVVWPPPPDGIHRVRHARHLPCTPESETINWRRGCCWRSWSSTRGQSTGRPLGTTLPLNGSSARPAPHPPSDLHGSTFCSYRRNKLVEGHFVVIIN